MDVTQGTGPAWVRQEVKIFLYKLEGVIHENVLSKSIRDYSKATVV